MVSETSLRHLLRLKFNTWFARELSLEQVVTQVMELAHVRFLPTYQIKNRLLGKFQVVSDAVEALHDAIEAESGLNDARNKTSFDGVGELNLLLNTEVEYNGRGSLSTHPQATSWCPNQTYSDNILLLAAILYQLIREKVAKRFGLKQNLYIT